MSLHILPTRTGGAAENMAIDFLLLQRYPLPATPRFRHYTWRAPAFTFGYSQKIAFIREELARRAGPESPALDVCRRPTGGGLVDHRDDWTFTLVIPRGHAVEELRATQSYRLVHAALAEALQNQGVPCLTQPTRPDENAENPKMPAGICFERAEIFDVVNARTGSKIAGAAQKRNKHGLLFQGSIWRPAAGGDAVDWEKFGDDFAGRLADVLATSPEAVPWPEFNEDEVSGLTEQYSSPEWIEDR
jgi:lipoate-protein ligase A